MNVRSELPQTSDGATPAPGVGSVLDPPPVATSWRDVMVGVLTVVLGLAAAALAAVSAVALLGGALTTPVLMGVAGIVALGAVLLAVTDIESFVLVVLVARSSLDAFRAQSSPGTQPAALVAVLVSGIAILWLLAQRRDPTVVVKFSPLTKTLLVFVGAALLGVVISPDKAVSAVEWARIASVAPMLILVEQLARRRGFSARLVVAVLVSALVPLAFGAHQALTGSDTFIAGGFSRVKGTFTHSNPFSVFLALLIVLAVALLPHVRRRGQVGLVVALAALAPMLIATYTRGSWIACVLGLFVVGALQSRKLIVAMLIGGAVLVAAVPSVSARFADLSQTTHASGTPGNSLTWRLEYWGEALSLSKQSPIAGVGLKVVATDTEQGKQPHNDIVRAYVELGVAGLLSYLALLVACVVTAARAVRETSRRRVAGIDRGIAVGFAGMVTAFLTLSLVANLMSQVVLLWYFFAIAGLAVAATARAVSSADEVEDVDDAWEAAQKTGSAPISRKGYPHADPARQ